jgi:hypothetical protein
MVFLTVSRNMPAVNDFGEPASGGDREGLPSAGREVTESRERAAKNTHGEVGGDERPYGPGGSGVRIDARNVEDVGPWIGAALATINNWAGTA